jgi:hypothetical protein
MQLNSSTPASQPTPAVLRPDAPARDRIRPLLADGMGALIPDLAFDTRIGKGTVGSEFDRNLRVRFEGTGIASQRSIVPETTTTQRLLASPAGPAFERLVRSAAAVADAANGTDNLHHLTLTPDEHAVKGLYMLGAFTDEAKVTGKPVRFTKGHWSKADLPAAEQRAALRYSKDIAAFVPGRIGQGVGAWNGQGDVVLTPDMSRNLLATIGAYRPQDGDVIMSRYGAPPASDLTPEQNKAVDVPLTKLRRGVLNWDTNALVHETHHSITPMAKRGSEETSIIEEAVSTIFGERNSAVIQRQAGLDVASVAANPAAVVDRAQLGWKPWNREHLPQMKPGEAEQVQSRYVDGPQVVRDLLKVFKVDLRTKAGEAEAFRLLQSRPAVEIPRFLANELIARNNLDPAHADKLTDRIRRSVSSPSGAGLVTKFLTELGATS